MQVDRLCCSRPAFCAALSFAASSFWVDKPQEVIHRQFSARRNTCSSNRPARARGVVVRQQPAELRDRAYTPAAGLRQVRTPFPTQSLCGPATPWLNLYNSAQHHDLTNFSPCRTSRPRSGAGPAPRGDVGGSHSRYSRLWQAPMIFCHHCQCSTLGWWPTYHWQQTTLPRRFRLRWPLIKHEPSSHAQAAHRESTTRSFCRNKLRRCTA